MKVVGARLADGVDNASHRATIFCRGVMGNYFEFLDRFHTEHLSPSATRSKILGIVHVGSVKHEQIRSEARPTDRKLGAAALIRTAACRRRHGDTRLQVNQLIETTAVQWKIAYLFFVNQSSHRCGCRLHLSAGAGDYDLFT